MTLTLRPYQTQLIDDIRAKWDSGAQNVLAVMPTGAGKTVAFSKLNADQRICFADLADQFLPVGNGARPFPIGVQFAECYGFSRTGRHDGKHVLRPAIPLAADIVDQLSLVWAECECHALLLSAPAPAVKDNYRYLQPRPHRLNK